MSVVREALHFSLEESDDHEEWVDISLCALGGQMSE